MAATSAATGQLSMDTSPPRLSIRLRERTVAGLAVCTDTRKLRQFSARVIRFATEVAVHSHFVEAAQPLSAQAMHFLLTLRPIVLQIYHSTSSHTGTTDGAEGDGHIGFVLNVPGQA